MKPDGHPLMAFRGVWVDDRAVEVIGHGHIPGKLAEERAKQAGVKPPPGAVYVFWGEPDENGEQECLYVGMTKEGRPEDRWRDHIRGIGRKEWADEVAEVEVLEAGTKRGAVRLERQKIRELDPRYNRVKYPEPTEYELTGIAN